MIGGATIHKLSQASPLALHTYPHTLTLTPTPTPTHSQNGCKATAYDVVAAWAIRWQGFTLFLCRSSSGDVSLEYGGNVQATLFHIESTASPTPPASLTETPAYMDGTPMDADTCDANSYLESSDMSDTPTEWEQAFVPTAETGAPGTVILAAQCAHSSNRAHIYHPPAHPTQQQASAVSLCRASTTTPRHPHLRGQSPPICGSTGVTLLSSHPTAPRASSCATTCPLQHGTTQS